MDTILGIIKESVNLLNKMSVYLLFGFLFGGILHIFVKTEMIAKHLGKGDFFSVLKATLFGIPLPLCSCGVLPAAFSLRKDGASKGSVLSFLISTPTTGLDSIFATYALLGGVFAVYRVIASFLAGLLAGISANLFFRNEKHNKVTHKDHECKVCKDKNHSLGDHGFLTKIKSVFVYGFGDLLKDVGPWLIIGIFVGGLISYLTPESFIKDYLGSGWQSMVIMLIIGIPMYVCSSGSIPIAAALMLKGMSPGAAFVFLLAGPATNSVALTVIGKQLGKKAVFIFLSSIIISALGLGMLLNFVWQFLNIDTLKQIMHHGRMFPRWVEISASTILVCVLFYNFVMVKIKSHKQTL